MKAQVETAGSRVRRIGQPADAIESGNRRRGVRWDLCLAWFLRLTALIWLARGVLNWAQIIGVDAAARLFADLPLGEQVLTSAYAVLDCVAAVGLWVLGFWGVVIWLALIGADLVIAVLFPPLSARGLNAALTGAGLALVYLALRYMEYRQQAKRRPSRGG